MRYITIPVSPSDLLDRISILEIKMEKITDKVKLVNIQLEHEMLCNVRDVHIVPTTELEELYKRLKAVNVCIWEQLDQWEEHCRKNKIDEGLAALLNAVQVNNNEIRFPIKREIDALLKSKLLEEKSYVS